MTLRARLGLAAGGAVALAVIAVAVSAYAGTRSQLRDQLDTQLQTLAHPIVMRAMGGALEPSAGGFPRGRGFPGSGLFGGPGPGFVSGGGDCDIGLNLGIGNGPGQGGAAGLQVFISPTGSSCEARNLNGATTPLPVSAAAKALARSQHGQFYADVAAGGNPFRMLVVGLPGHGALEVGLSLKNVNDALSSELMLIAIIAAAGIALAALLGFLVTRTALAPIARFTGQAERIAAQPDRVEHERLQVDGSDELARLGRTFNATLDALEASIAAQRNLVADASHELRTPIATIRANLQLMRDEELLSQEDRDALRSDMIDELDELTQLVGDVVELARGAKPPAEPGEVRLDLIAGEVLDRARRRAPDHAFDATLEPTLVSGEGARIDRAITNLLDNAAKYAPPGTAVEVALKDGVLTVRDHGPGFHDDDLPFVFDRFHRAKDARAKPGSGLGLAIVRQAAEAHGGFVEASNAPGGGALMRIGFGPVLELVE